MDHRKTLAAVERIVNPEVAPVTDGAVSKGVALLSHWAAKDMPTTLCFLSPTALSLPLHPPPARLPLCRTTPSSW